MEVHPMDMRAVRSLNIDQENKNFRRDYKKARDIWTAASRKGGLDDATLFQFALKYQKKEAPAPKKELAAT